MGGARHQNDRNALPNLTSLEMQHLRPRRGVVATGIVSITSVRAQDARFSDEAVLALLRIEPLALLLAAGGGSEDGEEVAVAALEEGLAVLEGAFQGTNSGNEAGIVRRRSEREQGGGRQGERGGRELSSCSTTLELL